MRRALQWQWTKSSIGRRPPNTAGLTGQRFSKVTRRNATSSTVPPEYFEHAEKEQKGPLAERPTPPSSLTTEQPEFNVPIRKQLSLYNRPNFRDGLLSEPARSQGRDTSTSPGSFNFPTNMERPETWSMFLEAVRARRRHSGFARPWALYLEMTEKKLNMPTRGNEAVELWDHFVQIGSNHPKGLSLVAEYAVGLYERTGMARLDLYRSVVGQQLWRYPNEALELHRLLKTSFPPDREDFASFLRLSLQAGQESFKVLGKIYIDCPIPKIYSAVVPELCKRNMRTEATNWHFLLVEKGDLPTSFHDCKPLFQHYSHIKKDKVVEDLARSLVQSQLWFEKDVDNFVQNDKFISREIMNRALGEAHNIAPKSLSDDFCARLFATKFFSVPMVVSGLQIMGLESLGPSSLREMVVRDGYHCETVLQHIKMLREGGVTLQNCRYITVIQNAAFAGRGELLKSMTSNDLHPDTFEDIDLQERLLAMYWKSQDHEQIERTLAVFQMTTPGKVWETYRANLLLRCHISLGNRAQVVSTLDSMQRNRYPLAPRSSRHLRSIYLSLRRNGAQPSHSRQALEDITLVINVMRMSLQSGGSLPIEAWREILKRLGMMGQLDRFQSLALWLVEWYSRPNEAEPQQLLGSTSIQANHTVSHDNHLPSESLGLLDSFSRTSPMVSRGNTQIQNRDLLKLFGKHAQRSIIAWGFQSEVRRHPNLPQSSIARGVVPQPHWQWGLRLLKELQLRGVQINNPAVARACRRRLAQLFGVTSVSRNLFNQRAKALNDERSKLLANFRYGAYIQEIEHIWGRHFLNSFADSVGSEILVGHAVPRIQTRRMRYVKMRRRKRYPHNILERP